MSYNRDKTGRRIDSFKIADGAPAIPAVSLTALPTFLNSQLDYQAQPAIRDNVVTLASGDQYAVYYDTRRMPVIAHRTLPNGAWTTFDLSTITGNPLAAPVVIDGHNQLSMGVDSAGYIHISGNHHDVPLNYVRSVNPNDITAWAAPGMVGTDETSVTYPQFVTVPGHGFYFVYRNGVAGDGDVFINKFDTTAQTWSRVSKPVIGTGLTPDQSPYINQPIVSTGGKLGLFVVYRISDSAATNHDIGYVESSDGGATWHDIHGTALALPIYPSGSTGAVGGSPLPLALTSSGQGLLNQNGAAFDSLGRPHAAAWLNNAGDSSKLDLHHVWWNGTAWRDDIVTTVDNASSGNTINIARVAVVGTNDGRTLLIYRVNLADPASMWVADVSDTVTPYPRFKLCDIDLGGWEPTFDYNAVRTLNQLHLLITPLFRPGSITQLVGTAAWQSQWGGILSLDLDQLGLLAAGHVPPPTLTRLARASLTTASASSSTLADAAVAVPLAKPNEMVLARIVASASAGGGRVSLTQRSAIGGQKVELASLPVASGSTTPATTIASGSNNVQAASFLGSGTLNVASTSGFPSSGTLLVHVGDPGNTDRGVIFVEYTGTTGTTFTGCTAHMGGLTGPTSLLTANLVQLALVAASPWTPVRLDLGDWSSGGKLIPMLAAPSSVALDYLAVETAVLGQPGRPVVYQAPRGVTLAMLGKLWGWWKRSSLTSNTNGATINSWGDASGNGLTLINPGGTAPTYNSTGLNGGPAVQFNGSQVLTTIGSRQVALTSSGGFAVLCVAATTSTASATDQIIIASDISAQSSTRVFQMRYEANAATASVLGFDGSGALTATSGALTGPTSPRLFRLQRAARYINLDANGTRIARATNGGDTPNGAVSTTVAVGRRADGGSDGGLIGVVSEAMVFSAALSGPEADAAQNLLAADTGITLP